MAKQDIFVAFSIPNKMLRKIAVNVPLTALDGFEPSNAGVKFQCLTFWRKGYFNSVV